MTEEEAGSSSSLARRIAALSTRARRWSLVQTIAIVIAVAFAYHGARLLRDNRTNFDESMLWLGLALLATLVASWRPPASPAGERRPFSLGDFWRDHWLEISLFALIFAFGVFMRVYRFQTSIPPADGLCCEEHINGGVAFLALEGDRPLSFPLVRWASAGGFLLFGENTLGLRFFFVAMGIASMVPFYFLLRQMTRPPAALFGLALFAAAWWPALRTRTPTGAMLYAVLLAFFLVRGLQTKNPLMLFATGIFAALVSYEYEAFKVVPLIAAGFVGAATLRELFLRYPVRPSAVVARARELFRVAWRPALIFIMAAGIVAVPLIVRSEQGEDLYLNSVHRQEGSRGDQRIAENWEDQLKQASQVFLPVGPNEYVSGAPRDFSSIDLIDPITAWLSIAGIVAGAVFFYRGFRLLFVSWFVLTLVGGSLLLHNFSPWKFMSLVPVGIVLAALLIDDVHTAVDRYAGRAGRQALAAVLALAVAFSFWWNADALFNEIGPSFEYQQAYSASNGQFYAFCDYLQDRGSNNEAIAFSSVHPQFGFAWPRETIGDKRLAWGDFLWVCDDLEGRSLPAAQEAWPLRDLPNNRTTLIISTRRDFEFQQQLVEELNRVYPGLGEPDRVFGPGDTAGIISYEFNTGQMLATYGLAAEYIPSAADRQPAARTDPVHDLQWDRHRPPVDPPFTVVWRGLAYVDERASLSLQALTDDPIAIRLSGQIVYDTGRDDTQASFVDVVPGWHPVEITLDKRDMEGSLQLNWVDRDGTRRPLQQQDLFPLAELSGWRHTRALGLPDDPDQLVSERLDFSPHLTSTSVVRLSQNRRKLFVTEDRWHGVWHVDADAVYTFTADFQAGQLELLIDGESVQLETLDGLVAGRLTADVLLAAGTHEIDFVQTINNDVPWAGFELSVTRTVQTADGPAGQPFEPRVTPY